MMLESKLFIDEITSIPTPTLSDLKRIKRADGYLIPASHYASVQARLDEITAEGYGEGLDFNIAIAKAKSEAVERFALHYLTRHGYDSKSSNGWACHFTIDQAVENAAMELIERGVALTAWQMDFLFFELPQILWTPDVHAWNQSRPRELEFSELKIYLSVYNRFCCISALLFNKSGNFISGHASALEIDDAISSAVRECLRAAHLAIRMEFYGEVLKLHDEKCTETRFSPGAHALAYAYSKRGSIRSVKARPFEILSLWQKHEVAAQEFIIGAKPALFQVDDRFVVQVKSPIFPEMYWGKSPCDSGILNQMPHFVG